MKRRSREKKIITSILQLNSNLLPRLKVKVRKHGKLTPLPPPSLELQHPNRTKGEPPVTGKILSGCVASVVGSRFSTAQLVLSSNLLGGNASRSHSSAGWREAGGPPPSEAGSSAATGLRKDDPRSYLKL
ncbi:hypothetical protein NL676_007561 [Syzygium grande]|nr:hypothetical protein NL676_007561 [Syzygium grande]